MRKTVKTIWICPNCHSDNVLFKVWTKANGGELVDDNPMEDDDCYCEDCNTHLKLITIDIKANAKVQGFQVIGEDGTDKEGCLHPKMDASFCIYSLSQCREMIAPAEFDDSFSSWRLSAIWKGDIEEPTMMFKGNPRD